VYPLIDRIFAKAKGSACVLTEEEILGEVTGLKAQGSGNT